MLRVSLELCADPGNAEPNASVKPVVIQYVAVPVKVAYDYVAPEPGKASRERSGGGSWPPVLS